jgi:UDP-glucose 4-epimerase
VGIGNGFSVVDVISAVEKASGKKVNWSFGPRRGGDPPTLVADSGAFQRDAGFTPQVTSLDQMVSDALNWRTAHPRGYA